MIESTPPVLTEPFVLYQSTLLSAYAERLIHGFTGKGHASQPTDKPFTLGGASYPPELVQENRLQLCRTAGLNETRMSLPRQTHTDCYRLNDLPCQDETDAVILTEPGIAGMVQVADCVPVILYAPERHIGAVVHAGWRGTAQRITQKVAQVLITAYQADPSAMIAVIGPSIGGCCYEVSGDVAAAVAETIPGQPVENYRVMQENGKPRIDLKAVNALQLSSLGLVHLECLAACTLCSPDRLWSHRRGEAGRQVAFLQLKASKF